MLARSLLLCNDSYSNWSFNYRPCGCGAGESGCTECGACKSCAGEEVEEIDDLAADLKAGINKVKDSPFELPPYLIMGEYSILNC